MDKTALVTGASSGIGAAAAMALARDGYRIIALGRDRDRMAGSIAAIRAASPDARIDTVFGDLAVMAEAARMAREVAALTPRIDRLILNAGGILAERQETADGFEATFAGNHLGHFLLTTRLLPLLPRHDGAQIIATSSVGHRIVKHIEWDDLQSRKHYRAFQAYGLAKLCNILFARELAKRLADDGIAANAVHPGVIASNFLATTPVYMRAVLRLIAPLIGTPAAGADTIVWLATDPAAAGETGGYWAKRRRIAMSAQAADPASAHRLWEESERLIAQTGA